MADSVTPPMNPHQKPQEDVVVTQEDYCIADYIAVLMDNDKRERAANIIAKYRLLGHEAGRRDMREAAGKVAEAWLLSNYSEEANVMAQNIRDDILALPTEPLGGEGPKAPA